MIQSEKERKQFARRVFQELQSMGFSRVTASKIMESARPAMAVKSAQWAKVACELVQEHLEKDRGSKPITPDEIRLEVMKRVEKVINTFSHMIPEYEKANKAAVAARLREVNLRLPVMSNQATMRLMLGAQEALTELPRTSILAEA